MLGPGGDSKSRRWRACVCVCEILRCPRLASSRIGIMANVESRIRLVWCLILDDDYFNAQTWGDDGIVRCSEPVAVAAAHFFALLTDET